MTAIPVSVFGFNHRLLPWRWMLGIAVLIALKIMYAILLPVNGDEPQHLHVVWAWSQGLLPFRDVFDNHTQLFQLLNAPLLNLIGENPDVIVWMRLAVIPWYLLMLWCTYRIGVVLYSQQVGLWAAGLCGLYPIFFIVSIQFRPDNAWAAMWLLLLGIAIEGKFTLKRAFVVGVLAGIAWTMSVKTLLLGATLLLAMGVLLLLLAWEQRTIPWRLIALRSGSLFLGSTIAPSAMMLFFILKGSGQAMWYGIAEHNLVPGLGHWHHWTQNAAIFPLLAVPLIFIAREFVRRNSYSEQGFKRALVFLASSFYLGCLYSYWPLVTQQDLLPFIPLAIVSAIPLLLNVSWSQISTQATTNRVLLPSLLTLELVVLVVMHPPWKNEEARYTRELRTLLTLTNPDDYVMDAKGESIFRNRPFFYALEGITLKRMKLGLLIDDIPQRLVATKTPVVVLDRLQEATTTFVRANYLPISERIFVAGQWLPEANPVAEFDVQVSMRYAILSSRGTAKGILDGSSYEAPRILAPGHHVFISQSDTDHIAVVWAQAYERGFSPFAPTRMPTPW